MPGVALLGTAAARGGSVSPLLPGKTDRKAARREEKKKEEKRLKRRVHRGRHVRMERKTFRLRGSFPKVGQGKCPQAKENHEGEDAI